MRAIDLGQDRYKRNYWVLPNSGGVYLEGVESGEIKDIVLAKTRSERSDSKTLKIEVMDEKTVKKGVEFLEEFPEKKASEILKGNKEGLNNVDRKCTDGKQVNGMIKAEKEVEVKSESKELVKVEPEGEMKMEIETNGPKVEGDVWCLYILSNHNLTPLR